MIEKHLVEKIREVCVEASLSAGEVIRESYGKVKQIDFKGEIDIVTEVDKASEKIIVEKIRDNFPNHSILAEESGLFEQKSSVKWIIDPLDGTTNFSHGYKCFCVSIAVEIDGEIVVGAVYNPMADELFTAKKFEGAFLNGEKISVSKTLKTKQSLLCTGFSYNFNDKIFSENIEMFKKFSNLCQAVRRDGSAALDLCYVACGRFDGFWEADLKPWDLAAGSLIVSEAGGKLSDYSGNTFSAYGKEILAGNPIIFLEMLEVLSNFRR
ncbi:inositol monophosphatase [bacterium]|nr:inositol monophosphatase [bacterium]